MSTLNRKQLVKLIKTAALELRYCGYNARADYQLMQVAIRGIDDNELQKIGALHSYRNVCIVAPDA